MYMPRRPIDQRNLPLVKTCPDCNTSKGTAEFNKDRTHPDGLCAYCRDCSNAWQREYRKKHPEKLKASQTKYYTKHKARIRKKTNQHYKENNVAIQRHRRSRRVGVDADVIDQTHVSVQSGLCGICRASDPRSGKTWWCADHDHETGAFRGVLCVQCNLGLGHFKDSPELLMAAIEYLRSTPYSMLTKKAA